jgi:MFS family permease
LWLVLANRRQVNAFRPMSSAPRALERPPQPTWEMPRLRVAVSSWRRFRLRAFLTAAGSRDGLFGALAGVVLVIGAVILQYFFGPGDPGTPLALALILSIIAPIIVASRTTALRPALLVHDMLLPQSRRESARDHGLAILANLFSFWAAAHLALILSYAVLGPDDLRLFGRSLIILLLLSAAFQIFFFGLLAWYLSFRPSFLSGIALFTLSCGIVPLTISFFDRPAPLIAASFGCAGAMFFAGVVLSYTALARWSRCEIK